MPDKPNKIRHYRTYMDMYGKMLQDLSHSENYITRLINNNKLDEFETSLRALIEKSFKR
ncbi:hypothetical protein W03_18040 [Nitrosomonas sp. PY1]|uniref:hypothetical protein n=1 Tax=Nitrosomonas sp. PY1 TaxID=1803906 RepID=UPI001FC8378F|nr:hypothetical protein [Nitrosomonas sp. PY1]GKS69800.1 hypothetical protein W03_18040 [Nitrosomonas sp. PY1]